MNFINKLKKQDIAWRAFKQFVDDTMYNPNLVLEDLQFEYQLGVFLKFFEHYGYDTDSMPGIFDIQNKVEEYKEGIGLGFISLNKELKDGTK